MSPARPMQATSGPLPVGPGWVDELKWDGMRAVVQIAGAAVRLWRGNGKGATVAYPELAALGPALAHLDV